MKRGSPKAQPPLLRRLNEREVLSVLQRRGPLSRAEIARLTGISAPTITRTVGELLEADLLEEGDSRAGALGRPGKIVRLASSRVFVVGVVVGSKRCELASAGLDGQLHQNSPRPFPTPSRYPDLVKAIVRQVQRLSAERAQSLLGVGISIPGLLNRWEKRTVISPNLHQTDGQQLGDDVQRQLQVETTLLQESHALCLAEMTYGAAREVDDFAMLDISEGLGLGVVNDGVILQGHSGLAGELGHITVVADGEKCGCGNRGCLETVATDTALAAAISRRLQRTLSIEEVVLMIRSGQLGADSEIDQVLQYLAVGMAAVINIFNPNKLFLYGHFLDIGAHLFDRLLRLTRERTLAPSLADCEIIRARGSKSLGAIAGVIQRLTTGRGDALP